MEARPLHWCLKIADRPKSIEFYEKKLEMTVLRHEEFAEGCAATCNGAYNNRWSKTMIGYGPEDSNFILELTYNFDVKLYEVGNDYAGIVIESTRLFEKLAPEGKLVNENLLRLTDPDGYPVQLVRGDSNKVIRVELNVEKLEASLKYWCSTLGMKNEYGKNCLAAKKYVDLVFKDGQVPLRLKEIGVKIDHKTGFGRIAFATPSKHQEELNQKILASKEYKFKHHKIELGTPGKASVHVIILLSHPDEYEICFVNDEDYSVLSKTDPNAKQELERELKKEAAKKEAAKKAAAAK